MAISATMNRGIALLLLLAPFSASAASKVMPLLQHQIPDQRTGPGLPTRTIALDQYFGAEPIDNQVVRFTYPSPTGGAPLLVDMAMFTTKTPVTRTNFLGYVTRGDYNRSIVHRRAAGFVLQGGGFTVDTANALFYVPQQAAILNEFGASNTFGTVAMAKLGSSPDSATSQWFINLADNSDNLNNQNGGFTVFAKVTKSTLPTVAALSDATNYPLFNFGSAVGGAFTSTPLYKSYLPEASARSPNLSEWQLSSSVALAPITPSDAGESTGLTYSVTTTPSTGLANVTLQGNVVTVTPNAGQTTTMTVKVTATDSVGNTVEDTFLVLPPLNYAAWRTASFSTTNAANEAISGPNADPDGDGVKNFQLFLHGLPVSRTSKPPVASTNAVADSLHRPRFTFPIRNDISGVSYTLEKTTTLAGAASWTTVPFTEVSRTTLSTLDTVTLQPTDAVATMPAFYRVKFNVQ